MLCIDDVLKRLQGVVEKGDGQYMAMCPCHADKKPSLAVRMGDKNIIFKCFAGCETENVIRALGLEMKEVCQDNAFKNDVKLNKNGKKASVKLEEKKSGEGDEKKKKMSAQPFRVGGIYTSKVRDDATGEIVNRKETITSVYTYEDKERNAILMVARTDKKSFPVIHKDGDEWFWGDGGNSSILYRLPEVLKGIEEGHRIFIVEGEKDVDNLFRLGFIATTNKGGAGKWSDALTKVFKDAKVVVIPDFDEPGRRHADFICKSLNGVAKETRRISAKKICEKIQEKGDISDVIDVLGESESIRRIREVETKAAVINRIVDDADYAEFFDGITGYKVINGCISKRFEDSWQALCNFTALPIAEVVKDDGNGDLSTSFSIVGWSDDGKRLKEITVSADEFAKMNWPLKQWGLAAIIKSGNSTKERLREAIQIAGYRSAVRKMSYSHTGWRMIDGRPVFLHGGGAIGAEDISVELDYGFNRYDLNGVVRGKLMNMSAEKRLEECIWDTVHCMNVAGLRVGLPLVSYMFLSPLKHFLEKEGHRPSFIPFLRGRTGSGKSVMGSLVMNYFGRDFSYDTAHPASFDDTVNGISLKLFVLKDMPLMIDDYHPESNPHRKRSMEDVAQKVSRMIGDGARRSRMRNDTTGQVDKPARGMCIETGEDLPNITESGVARMYVIDLKKGDVPLGRDDLTILQKKAREGNFSEVMKRYIEWLIPQYETLPAALDLRYEELLREAIEKIQGQGAHARIPPIIAFLMLGYEMMFKFFISSGVFKDKELNTYMELGWQAILENTEKQVSEMVTEKPTKMFVDTLIELIENKRVSLGWLNSGERTYPVDSDKNSIGYVDFDYYYLSPGLAYEAVQKTLSGQGTSFPISKKMLMKLMGEEGILEKDYATGKNVKQLNRNGIRGWFMFIRRELIDKENEEQQKIEFEQENQEEVEEDGSVEQA